MVKESALKTYYGHVPTGDHSLYVTVRDHKKGLKALSHHLRYSPTGYNWGYGGSGPSELARCILLDAFGVDDCPDTPNECRCDNNWAESSYPAFRDSVISDLKQEEDWKLYQDWILDWVFDHLSESVEIKELVTQP